MFCFAFKNVDIRNDQPFFSYPFANWMALKMIDLVSDDLPSLELEQIKAESETDAENEDKDPEDDVDSVDPCTVCMLVVACCLVLLYVRS